MGWIKVSDQTILALHKKVITHNSRVLVTHDEQRTWNLIIRQVQEEDRGCYMCQINTALMKKQLGCVDVLGKLIVSTISFRCQILTAIFYLPVPPDFITDDTSSDVTVTEGQDITLSCSATGHPKPRISWKKEDSQPFVVREGNSKRKSIYNIFF